MRDLFLCKLLFFYFFSLRFKNEILSQQNFLHILVEILKLLVILYSALETSNFVVTQYSFKTTKVLLNVPTNKLLLIFFKIYCYESYLN